MNPSGPGRFHALKNRRKTMSTRRYFDRGTEKILFTASKK